MQQCPNRVAYLKDTVDQGRFSFVTDPRWTTFEGATCWLASSMSMNSLFEAESEVCAPFRCNDRSRAPSTLADKPVPAVRNAIGKGAETPPTHLTPHKPRKP